MKFRVLNLLAAMSIGSAAIAEIIDGPANIRRDVNSTIIASINDGVEAEIRGTDGNWHDVAIYVTAHGSSLVSINGDIGVLEKDQIVYDSSNREAGQSREQLVLHDLLEQSDGFYRGYLEGQTHRQNIKPESVSERELQRIFEENQSPYAYGAFDDYLTRLGYTQWINDQSIETYLLYAPSSNDDPSPGPRNILAFYNGTLIAVIYSDEYRLDYLESNEFVPGFRISIMENTSPEVATGFIEKYSQIMINAD